MTGNSPYKKDALQKRLDQMTLAEKDAVIAALRAIVNELRKQNPNDSKEVVEGVERWLASDEPKGEV